MNDVADDPKAARPERHERRAASVSAPYGPLPLADYPEGRIPAVPGHRHPTGDGVAPTASAEDGLGPDGEPFGGEAVLAEDGGAPAHSRLAAPADARIAPTRREGAWAVRVYDPASAARQAFGG
ncbi:hypothetical protein ABZ924_36420 [Streptomyces sp. NPDC046876]|uniref:hypothetical protein n=1 Tax=Streptomyces sp. NPDC046876 TaxID=3155616 RepID=UPI0033CB3B34